MCDNTINLTPVRFNDVILPIESIRSIKMLKSNSGVARCEIHTDTQAIITNISIDEAEEIWVNAFNNLVG